MGVLRVYSCVSVCMCVCDRDRYLMLVGHIFQQPVVVGFVIVESAMITDWYLARLAVEIKHLLRI